jgi:PAS domain S-box-containing protein
MPNPVMMFTVWGCEFPLFTQSAPNCLELGTTNRIVVLPRLQTVGVKKGLDGCVVEHSPQTNSEQAAHLAHLLSLSYEPMLAWRLDGAIEFWNAGAERLYGFAARDAVGRVSHSLLQTRFPVQFGELRSHLLNNVHWSGELRHICKDGREVIVDSRMQLFGDHTILEVNRDITRVKALSETQQLLIAELNHRVKNTLASVQAIMHQTLRRAKDPAEFVTSFTGRIQSLSQVHTLLSIRGWQDTDLHTLIRNQLFQGAGDETKISIIGPQVRLSPQIALILAPMLHELGTNAIKYGALSSAAGIVTISWAVKDSRISLQWAERGGPAPVATSTRGFGTALIEKSAQSPGGSARMLIDVSGVVWNIEIPLDPPQSDLAKSSIVGVLGIAHANEVPATQAVARLSGKRFLVVEDEPLAALDIAAALEDAGVAEVAQSSTVREALEMIERSSFDAALLDANLHGQSVDQIAAALSRCRVPFLFVTGYERSTLPKAFANAAIVTKPFSWQELIHATAAMMTRVQLI